MVLESLFIFRNTKWHSHIPFYGRRALKWKRLTDVIFLFFGNYRDEILKNLRFEQNLNSHLYKAETFESRSCGFCVLFYWHGRWCKEMCFFFFFFFFLQQRKNWGGDSAISDRMEKIKIKHLWKFPLTHFRHWDQVILIGEPQLENSLLWYSNCLSSQNIVENLFRYFTSIMTGWCNQNYSPLITQKKKS